MKHARNCLVALLALTAGACRPESRSSTAASAAANATSGPAVDTAEARRLVQGFYDWYAPLAVSMSKEMGAARATHGLAYWDAMRGHSLSADLVDGLRADSLARLDRSTEHELLEGDPFLWSQDVCEPYRVTGVDGRGDRVLVTVTATCAGTKNPVVAPPTPVVEVRKGTAGLEISNVFYDSLSLTGRLCVVAAQMPTAKKPQGC